MDQISAPVPAPHLDNSSNSAPTLTANKPSKSQELLTCTVREPPFSYLHLELLPVTSAAEATTEATAEAAEQTGSGRPILDPLLVRALCTSAAGQFLGVTGLAVPVDVLSVRGPRAWVRVPRDDLARFATAITAWPGTLVDADDGKVKCIWRLKACSDWLGSLVGRDGQEGLWG